jgi:hypothetical protein
MGLKCFPRDEKRINCNEAVVMLKQDSVVIKVVQSRGSARAILTTEDSGPAGTLHGLRMPFGDRSILSDIVRLVESGLGSFEVLIVVPKEEAWILAAFINSTQFDQTGARSLPRVKGVEFGGARHYTYEDIRAAFIPWSRTTYMPKEWENGKQEVEMARLQALKKIDGGIKKLVSSSATSDEKKVGIFNKAADLIHDIFEACQNSLPFEEALRRKVKALPQKKGEVFWYRPKPEEVEQLPDLSKIPLWQGRKRDGMPLDFLKTHYGQWLSAFGAERNSVFQDQIRAHDPGLIKGVHNHFRNEGKGRKLHDFVKTRSARVDQELESINSAYLKKAERLSAATRRRQDRAQAADEGSSEEGPLPRPQSGEHK